MVQIRPAAAQEIRRLLRAQSASTHHQEIHIHLSLEPGGCGEWTYQLTAAKPFSNPTTLVTSDDICLTVPADQISLLQDLTIDYTEDLMGGGFRFVNPQARFTCGCGNAFSVTANPPAGKSCILAEDDMHSQSSAN